MQIRADGKGYHTRGAYLRDLRRLEDWLGSITDASNITPAVVAKYLARCSNGSPAITVNRTKTALRVFFKFLTDAGYIESSPARLIKNGRTEPKTPDYFKPTEARRFLRIIPTGDSPVALRDRLMFSILLGTGIRLGSLVKLRAKDVDLKGRYVNITAKGEVERKVYFNSSLSCRLKAYITASGLSLKDPLFPSRNGGHLSSRQVQLRFKHWLSVAGIDPKYSVHSLRHTFAMNLYRKTGDLRLVQTALGHKRITTTEIYARTDDRRLKRALEKL